MVTGTTYSRLEELVKYGIGNSFSNKYRKSNTISVDGVNYDISTENYVVYYINGITYVDDFDLEITTYSYPPKELDYGRVDALRIYKDPKKMKIRNNPTTTNDLDIDRQEISVFDGIYKLSDLENLEEVASYAGGKYFDIINNM